MRFLVIPNTDLKGGSLLTWYLMSQVLFSSFQFKLAQYYTWVMKNIAKHKQLLNILCIVYFTMAQYPTLTRASTDNYFIYKPVYHHILSSSFSSLILISISHIYQSSSNIPNAYKEILIKNNNNKKKINCQFL